MDIDVDVTFTLAQAKAIVALLEKYMAGNAYLVHGYDALCDAIADAEDEEE